VTAIFFYSQRLGHRLATFLQVCDDFSNHLTDALKRTFLIRSQPAQ